MSTQRSMATRLLWVLAASLLVLAFVPQTALARDYSIDRVDIDATVGSDGSLSVKELREFDFDGSFRGVYWDIPTGSYQGRSVDTSILSVGEIVDGRYIEFLQSDSGLDHTYEIREYYSYVEVKLYSSHENESAQFAIAYRDSNLATRYDDTSELYWKFVSDGWDVESQNVSCVIHLPVPSGEEVVPGENVRAWGHGPLDANVGFSNGDVTYFAPGVGTSEFAEARITFPAEWLPEVASAGYAQLDDILAEEQQWADEANARRERSRRIIGTTARIGGIIPCASGVFAIVRYRRYRNLHKAQFDDKYFRDLPSDDHPAVLGALLNNGNVSNECLTASLMRLTDQGNASLELVKYKEKGLFGKEKISEDYCLTPLEFPSDGERATARHIDYETMCFAFRRLMPLSKKCEGSGDELYFGSLEKVAKKYPEQYDRYRKDWEREVEAACKQRGFFKDDNNTSGTPVVIAGIVDILVAVITFFALVYMEAPFGYSLLLFILTLTIGIALTTLGASFENRSREAIELTAKLNALKRWLKDFTRLEEAIPQDVVLWNRLLVMAVVLGVADEVIKQLKMVAPELLASTALSSTYGWYYAGGPSAPMRSFTKAAASAHSVSAAKLASSSSSSGGGGGGGFSSGGGGGFGGGGGGGAF